MTNLDNSKRERFELLDRDEELALVRQYRATGDRKVEDRLVRSQLRLAAHFARGHCLEGEELRDLVQEGALGVVEAVRRFDPERGVRLSTYAALWIRAYQLRFLLKNHRLVRLGSTEIQRKLFFQLRSTKARLEAAGVDVSTERLADALGVSVGEVKEMARRLEQREVSLDEMAASRHGTRAERLAADGADPAIVAEQRELLLVVGSEAARLCNELQGRDRSLFESRFCEDASSLSEVGRRFGISRERTRQLEVRLLGLLRSRVEARIGSMSIAA